MIHRFSGGIPRLVNNICDNALLTGFSEASPRITASIIGEVVRILDLAPYGSALPRTAGEFVARVSGFNTQNMYTAESGQKESAPQGGSNVRYIRRESTSEDHRNVGAQAPASSNFTIESGDRGDSAERSKFFQRARVTRSS